MPNAGLQSAVAPKPDWRGVWSSVRSRSRSRSAHGTAALQQLTTRYWLLPIPLDSTAHTALVALHPVPGACSMMGNRVTRGGVKKKMTKATYICRSAKKKVVTYFILFLFLFLFFIDFFKGVFWAFRNKVSSKTRKKLFFRKSPSRLITKNAAFFSSVFFFPPSVVLFDFFYIAFLGVS
jgi:hypothetical protein